MTYYPTPDGDLIEDEGGGVTQRARTFIVQIKTPNGGERVIEFPVEAVILSGDKTLGKVDTPPPWVIRQFTSVQIEVIELTDPVTGKVVTISVAGLAVAIQDRFITWFMEDQAKREAPPVPPEK
jgi:hypothetical protein